MFAIIKTGGKQYKVEKGQTIYVEKLEGKKGDSITFDHVLFADGKFGSPTIKGASVLGKIIKQGKEKKVIIFKYKPKKKSTRKKQGHRQPYSAVEIKEIKLK